MHCLQEQLVDTKKKSSDTVADKRCDDRRQITEMEDKVYAKSEKAEDMRRFSRQQAVDIIAEQKQKVDEVMQFASKKMAEKMAKMEENNAEV